MPRYFFDVETKDLKVRDQVGMKLPDDFQGGLSKGVVKELV